MMAPDNDVILKGGTVVNHDGIGTRDIAISGGRIKAIGDLARASAAEIIDCRGLTILPGVIDAHVHFREPGSPEKEDMESGSRAAVLGGARALATALLVDPAGLAPDAPPVTVPGTAADVLALADPVGVLVVVVGTDTVRVGRALDAALRTGFGVRTTP